MSKTDIILHYFCGIRLLEEYNELVSVNMLGVKYGETLFLQLQVLFYVQI